MNEIRRHSIKAAEKEPEKNSKLGKEKLQSLFDIGYHLKNVDYIFRQVFDN